MKRRNSRLILLAFAALAYLGIAPAGMALAPTGTAAAAPVAGGSITIPADPVPSTLDPGSAAAQRSEAPWFYMVYGSLFRVTPSGALQPDLATGYKTSANGLTATITLRPKVTFSDGTPFNAAAVVFNLDRDLKSCTCKTFLNTIKSVSAAGNDSVEITLSQPDYLLQDVLSESGAAFMISPTAFRKEGEKQIGLKPVGAGPYTVKSFTPAGSITYSKNSRYYQKPLPYLDTINVSNVTSDSALQAGCESQTLMFCGIGIESLATTATQLANKPNLTEVNAPRVYWSNLNLNTHTAPFKNPLARQALAYATDKKALSTIPAGHAAATCTMAASGTDYWTGAGCPAGGPNYTYNPKKAAQLVKQVGGMNFTLMDAVPDSLEMTELQAMQKEWQAVGMKVTLRVVPHSTEISDEASGNFNVILGGGGGFLNPFLGAEVYLASGSADTAFSYSSKAQDEKITALEAARTKQQQTKAWGALMAEDNKGLGNISLYQSSEEYFVNKKLHGVQFAGYFVYLDRAWVSQ